MWYVYILKSLQTKQLYIGSTNNLSLRFRLHNFGRCLATRSFRPWIILSVILLATEAKARKLEKYFKSGSGKAILKNRILQI